MKKTFIILAVVTVLLASMSSCADKKTFQVGQNDYIYAEPYGIADQDDIKMDTVVYRVSTGNVICSVIFCETAIVPIWLIGWQLYEPVRLKTTAEYNARKR